MVAGKIKIVVDPFLTQTRMTACQTMECRFNKSSFTTNDAGPFCMLKEIELDDDGKCKHRELPQENES